MYPARKPRIEWVCHPTAWAIVSTETPSGLDSSANHLALLEVDNEEPELCGTERFRDLRAGGLDFLAFVRDFVMAVYSLIRALAVPALALPQARDRDRAASAGLT